MDKDQWIAVYPGTKPMGVTDEEWKKLDRKANSTIRLCLRFSIAECIRGSYGKDFVRQIRDFVTI